MENPTNPSLVNDRPKVTKVRIKEKTTITGPNEEVTYSYLFGSFVLNLDCNCTWNGENIWIKLQNNEDTVLGTAQLWRNENPTMGSEINIPEFDNPGTYSQFKISVSTVNDEDGFSDYYSVLVVRL